MLRSVISPKTPTSPKVFQQDDASTPTGRSPTADMEDDDHHHHLKKFSVIAKVKERARKWKHSLSKKRMHSPHDHETNPTPSWGVTLDDDKEDDDDDHDRDHDHHDHDHDHDQDHGHDHDHVHDAHNVEDDSDFFGTPMREFEQPPEDSSASSESSSKKLDTYETAKMNNLTIGVPEAPLSGWEDEQQEWLSPGEVHWDKGVSVKEYLIEKLKPGEDDRALSQVISEAISLRKKDTNDSLRAKEEQPTHSTTDSMTNFPVSTNPHEVTEEEHRGQVLQMN